MPLQSRLYFRLTAAIVAPIAGQCGDVLAAWIGHPEHNVRVIDPFRQKVRRRALIDETYLFHQLQQLYRAAIIAPLTAEDERMLARFRRSA